MATNEEASSTIINNPLQFWEGYESYKDIKIAVTIDEDTTKGKIQTSVSDYMDQKIKVGLEGILYVDKAEEKVGNLIEKVESYQIKVEANYAETELLVSQKDNLDSLIGSYQSEIDTLMKELKDDFEIVEKTPKTELSIIAKIQQEIKENQAKIEALVLKKEVAEQQSEQIAREISVLRSQSLSLQDDMNSDIQNVGQELIGIKLEQDRFNRLLDFDLQQETTLALSSRNLTIQDFEASNQEAFIQSIMNRNPDATSQIITSRTLNIDENILAVISPTLLNMATQVMNSKITEFEVSSKRYLDLANGNFADAFHLFFQKNYDDLLQNKLKREYVNEIIQDAKTGVKDFWEEEKGIYKSSSSGQLKVASVLTESKLGQASVLALTVGLSSYGLASTLPVLAAAAVLYGAVRPLVKSIQHYAYSQTRLAKGAMGLTGYEKEQQTYRGFVHIKVDPKTAHNTDPSKINLITEYNEFERRMYNIGVFYASLKHNFAELLEPLKNLREGLLKLKDIAGNLIKYAENKRTRFSETGMKDIDPKSHNKNVVQFVIERLNEVEFDKSDTANLTEQIAYLIEKGNKRLLGNQVKPTEIMELTQINNLIRSQEFRKALVDRGFEVSDVSDIGRSVRLKLSSVKDSIIESPFKAKINAAMR